MTGRPLQMNDRQLAPFLAEVLGHQAAMATLRGGLAAQQHRGRVEEPAVELFLDLSFSNQREEAAFVLGPVASSLAAGFEDFISRREPRRLVAVACAADFGEEELQVVALGEAGKLRGLVKAEVDQ